MPVSTICRPPAESRNEPHSSPNTLLLHQFLYEISPPLEINPSETLSEYLELSVYFDFRYFTASGMLGALAYLIPEPFLGISFRRTIFPFFDIYLFGLLFPCLFYFFDFAIFI